MDTRTEVSLTPLIWEGRMPRESHRLQMVEVQQPEGRQGLYKLVLTVAQACNLRCTYCYAEGGPYGADVSQMNEATARKAIRSFFTRYDPIDMLQFFGGEPSLNLRAMQAAVAEVRAMVNDGAPSEEPRYGIVTNLLRLTDDLIDFYRDTRMKITVSHDGPESVQNAQRPGLRGEDSHAAVEQNLARLRDVGAPFDVQCTYTRRHFLESFSVPDLVSYFRNLGAVRVDIVPVTVPKGDPLDVFYSEAFEPMVEGYRQAVYDCFKDICAGRPHRFGMVDEALSLLRPGRGNSEHYCNAGVTTLTVAANGDVYPCFMFINKPGFKLGRVDDNHTLAAFARDPEKGIDKGCPGRQFMMNGEIAPFGPDDRLKQAVVDTVLECVDTMLTAEERRLGLTRKYTSSMSEA